jgi:mannose-1-phosphate guanylyltransferase/phosphomannomutase
MKIIIVAGGQGERFGPLTQTIPKPMLEVEGQPILEHIVRFFQKQGFNDFIFCLCHLPKVITSYFQDGKKFGAKITYLLEKPQQPMGTGGAVLAARKMIKGIFIVTYADILRQLDIKKMVKEHQLRRPLATINIYPHLGRDVKSLVVFNRSHEVKRFVERPTANQVKGKRVWSNGSFYVLQPDIFNYIPNDRPSDFGRDIFPVLLANHQKVIAYPTLDYLIDIANQDKLKIVRQKYQSC